MSISLDRQKLEVYKIPEVRDDYDPRDVIIYALGVGAGLHQKIDETALLFEQRLQALPTMALVLGTAGFWPMDPKTGLDWTQILHGEQRLKLFAPIEPAGILAGKTKITDIADKGAGKAAMIRAVKSLETLSGRPIAEAIEIWVVRGAGGFGGQRDLPGEPLPVVPARDPDYEISLPTSLTQAATYRLSGDRNPLHIDAEIAHAAGFDRPILHGLSTMGVAARALIQVCCQSDAALLSEISVRFTAPVYPGETLRTFIWRGEDAENGESLHFQMKVVERDILVIDNGLALIKAADLPAA